MNKALFLLKRIGAIVILLGIAAGIGFYIKISLSMMGY